MNQLPHQPLERILESMSLMKWRSWPQTQISTPVPLQRHPLVYREESIKGMFRHCPLYKGITRMLLNSPPKTSALFPLFFLFPNDACCTMYDQIWRQTCQVSWALSSILRVVIYPTRNYNLTRISGHTTKYIEESLGKVDCTHHLALFWKWRQRFESLLPGEIEETCFMV